MANYRQIHVQIWKDQWFLDLPPDFKLLFIYLFSNERTSVAGIYDLSLRVIEFETGLDLETIEAGLAEFARAGKAYYEEGLVWVVNLRKYNATNSIKVRTRIQHDLLALPDCNLLRRYLDHEGCPMEDDAREDYLDAPEDPPIESQVDNNIYPIQSEEISYPTGESEHDHVLSHAHDHVPVPARAGEETIGSGPVHPAIVRFVSVTGRKVPNEAWAKRIEHAVGPDPPNLARWTRVINGWVGQGWNPGNLQGMLEYYERNEIPGDDRKNGTSNLSETGPPKEPVIVRGLNELPDWLGGKGKDDA